MGDLGALLQANEEWLMARILVHAKQRGYTKYTSTLTEAWRISISGLTASLVSTLDAPGGVPSFEADEDTASTPLTSFGVDEAIRHRARGITITMFLGLLKLYRQTYLELVDEVAPPDTPIGPWHEQILRAFDHIEVALSAEWSATPIGSVVEELQAANRTMTNEKNRYLTVFESLSDPAVMLDGDQRLVNLNYAASLLLDPDHVPGGHYYQLPGAPLQLPSVVASTGSTRCLGEPMAKVFPWLVPSLRLPTGSDGTVECEATIGGAPRVFEVKRSDILDVSEKLTGTVVILRDVTRRTRVERRLRGTVADLEEALSQVKRLSGLLPICSHCKKVRDDQGYWSQVELYLMEHSEATFSHSVCPDCFVSLYPELADAMEYGTDDTPEDAPPPPGEPHR